jgi:exosortase/archaeosortase family protein
MISLTRARAFILTLAVTFLAPLAIPGVGLDVEFFIITMFVLMAWFLFRWEVVRSLSLKGGRFEVFLGTFMILADYAFNAYRQSTVGIVDLLVIFLGGIFIFYGVRAFRYFWVPALYGVILLLGYQIEVLAPNLTALQDWLAGVMAWMLNGMGITSSVTGEFVSMSGPNGAPIVLDVGGPCTGVQGIIAFGMLSTMTLLDTKPKLSRLIPIFAVGFIGAFLVNIVRLLLMFLTYEFTSLDVATTVHIYVGYFAFIVWVVVFWAIAFRYFTPIEVRKSHETLRASKEK